MMRPCDYHDRACLCTKAGFPSTPCAPNDTIPTSRVLRWCIGLSGVIAFALLVYSYVGAP